MEKSTINIHYQEIASDYTSLWFFDKNSRYGKWKLNHVCQKLNLQTEDKLCDIGGGPGNFALGLSQLANLSKKVLVVDTCEEFVNQASNLAPIEALHTDAFTFAATQNSERFDKILMKEMIHHLAVDQLSSFLSNLRQRLNPNGQLLIFTRPHDIAHIPLFEKAREEWAKHQLPASFYVDNLKKAGFDQVTSEVKAFSTPFSSDLWFQLIRKRFWSCLNPFSDQEIEVGILEIKEQIKEEHFIFMDKCVFITAWNL